MFAKKHTSLVLCLALAMLLVTGVGCGSKPTPTSELPTKPPALPVSTPTRAVAICPSAVHSPHGSVPFGAKACSPDDTKYAREIEPESQGRIGLFDVQTDKLLTEIKMGETNNDLKGLAWSPDSRWLAVMYHHGSGGYIAIVDAVTGEHVKYLTINRWYHHIEFSKDGKTIIAEDDTLDIGSLHTPTSSPTPSPTHIRASATPSPSPTRMPPTVTPRPTSMPTNTPTLTSIPTNTPTPIPPYTVAIVRTDTGIHCQVKETKTGRVVLTTWAQYLTFNDVKDCRFSSDWRKFAAAYHYGHAGNYTWIGVWSTETGKFLHSKTEPGWIGIPAGVFDQ
jgi:hypothetical protein